MSHFDRNVISHLFVDFDGIIIGTEEQLARIIYYHLGDILSDYDISLHLAFSEFLHHGSGRAFRELLQEELEQHGLCFPSGYLECEELRMDKILEEAYRRKLHPIPRTHSALLCFQALKIPVSIVSSASTPRVLSGVLQLGIRPWIRAIFSAVSSLEQPKPKPAPDIYHHAMAVTGSSLNGSLAVEASYHGALSAVSAGMRTLGFVGGLEASEEKIARTAKLLEAGVYEVAHSWFDVIAYIGRLNKQSSQ